MAGMFYSVKETAEKLKITEKEVKKLIKQDKLREFRIGSDLLLKVAEVEALAAEGGISAEPEVSAEEKVAEPVVSEISESKTEQEETTEPEAGEIELGELELPELESVEQESPVLDMAGLENLGVGEEVSAQKADVLNMKIDDNIAIPPKAASRKQRSRAKQRAVRKSSRPRLSIGGWFWRGLVEDSPVAVILLFLILGSIIIGCIALGTVLYEML